MSKASIILVLTLFPCITFAEGQLDFKAYFDTKANRAETLSISWMTVPMSLIQSTCELISKDSGFGGFNYSLHACSFWTNRTCLIVTGEQSTHEEIGHELRHCYQGNFH
jgi:hypothetical protein